MALGADATSRDGLSFWWQRPAALLSAGLVVAALIFTFAPRRAAVLSLPLPKPGSTEVVAFLPLGNVRRVSEFRWASPVDASRYLVVVRDGGTAEVLRRETGEQKLDIGADLANRFHQGWYRWKVEAVDVNGRVVAQSKTQTFVLW